MKLANRPYGAQADGGNEEWIGGVCRRFYAYGARLSRAEARARALKAECAFTTDAVEYLIGNIGGMQVYAQTAIADLRGAKRFSPFRSARLEAWADALVRAGEARPDVEEIIESLRLLDEKQMLRASEIWNAPNVLRVAAARAFLRAARAALKTQAQWKMAEKWSAETAPVPADASHPAFYEHALKLAADAEDAEKRARLLRRLALVGRAEADCVRISQETQSVELMKLENLMHVCRALDDADWTQVFSRVSFTEKTLMRDPSGVYPAMDEESREAVRAQAAYLSARTGYPERTIASLAVEAAREGGGVCDFLYTDEGRARLVQLLDAAVPGIRKMTPDPGGYGLISFQLLVFALVALIAAAYLQAVALVASLPALWVVAGLVARGAFARAISPKPLLRLDMKRVPEDARTLVVIPALIPDPARGAALMNQLEAFGALDENENVDYLLLGDFKDAGQQSEPRDAEILARVQAAARDMNARAGRRKYFYLNRARFFNERDGVWMGRERKRGALQDLNLLLTGGENRFAAEGAAGSALKGRYRYAVTVDADTEMIPGTVEKLIGAIHHPLNRPREDGSGYCVIQPRMEFAAEMLNNRFSRLFAGAGGADTYAACAADVYQDACGSGIFSGKGIYDIEEFQRRTLGAFDDNAILSHDLLEGIVVRAAYDGAVALYEGFPARPSSYLKRLERWTRGDWQLIPYLFGRVRMRALDRWKGVDNLIRSLSYPSVAALLILSVWLGSASCAVIGLFCAFASAIFARFHGAKAALGRLLLLPSITCACAGGAARALWRMGVTHKKMLEWVTAADADGQAAGGNTAGVAFAILLAPALLRPAFLPFALLLALAFIFGRAALDRLSQDRGEAQFTSHQFGLLMALGRDTWRYFEKYVPLAGNGLPPDNAQLDPPVGAAMRTSPTNVGMYLISCVSARELGLIDGGEMLSRMRETLKTLESLPKWNGLMYNWYDTRTLSPLTPRYVSSVDCGNLLACLVLCANAARGEDARLDSRFSQLIRDMELQTLYDPKRRLFRIGYDVERSRPSESYYDLMASEARILSYVAMAEKGVPVKHWARLGRPCARVKGGCALLSWSGTMFEYMMPFLFMPSAENSLLGRSAHGAVSAQIRYGDARSRPWGVSECAYRAFDAQLNYQYRAFGVPSLSISGAPGGDVVAPYAACLALAAMPSRAADHLLQLGESGLRGEFGLYEAADYAAADACETVFSYMTHHQGMSLAAVCNALTGDRLCAYFMQGARERALRVLLNEKPFARPRLAAARVRTPKTAGDGDKTRAQRAAQGTLRIARGGEAYNGHFLFGAGACAYIDACGNGFYRRDGAYANMWHGDPARYREALLPEVWDETGPISFTRAAFDAGSAIYSGKSENAAYEICALVSPETGEMLLRVRGSASSDVPVRARARQAFVVSLMDEDMMQAHPAFSHLFVKGEKHSPGALLFTRRKRREEDSELSLIHAVSGGEAAQTAECAQNRGDIGPFEENGAPLRPESVLETEWAIPAGQTASVYFRLRLAPLDAEEAAAMNEAAFERALSLSRAQARTMLSFCGVLGAAYRLLDRAAARLVCVRPEAARDASAPRPRGNELWPLGISGEKPILLSHVCGARGLPAARQMIRAHEFYQNAGVNATLVIVCEFLNDYLQPLRDSLEGMLRASHLCGQRNQPGGVYLVDAALLDAGMWALLGVLSALRAKDDFAMDVRENQRRMGGNLSRVAPRDMDDALPPVNKLLDNDFGGFSLSADQYVIDVLPGRDTPAPWSNLLANPDFGALVTEKGGGFIWRGNSRMGRLTPFDNDPAREGWGVRVYAVDEEGYIPLTPLEKPIGAYRVTHAPGITVFECARGDVRCQLTWHVDPALPIMCLCARVQNGGDEEITRRMLAHVDWLMGVDARDRRLTRCWICGNACAAYGRMDGVGFLASKGGEKTVCAPDQLPIPQDIAREAALPGNLAGTLLRVPAHGTAECAFLIGWAQDESEIEKIANAFSPLESRTRATGEWEKRLGRVTAHTGDAVRDALINRFYKYQALACRVFARTGLYQPGGAYGMRDQLQDMLCVLYMEPGIVRGHLLMCAARQFAAGDGLHWWHAPRHGVRTRISDDILFLPYVCAKYVLETGDTGILNEEVPYLEEETIPDGQEDWYGEARETPYTETLHAHCMAAFRRADSPGEHGLARMGTGDWNDGMNRIGRDGRGESVWLSEFLSRAAALYAQICPETDREYLTALSSRMKRAVEDGAWDGQWYLRAFDDEGRRVGSEAGEECRIDLITQAWASLNGQDEARVRQALDSAEERLVDRETGLIRLLAPPFTGKGPDPGYIAAYPPGIRENGGQYTHAACWLTAAYAKVGDAARAWEALDMLLPRNRASSREQALKYRGEPYAAAADISSVAPRKGVAGWTWYTGAAAWTVRVFYEDIMGLTIRGNRARMCALLNDGMEEASIAIRAGGAEYVLISAKSAREATLDGQPLPGGFVALEDDGRRHEARFPARN